MKDKEKPVSPDAGRTVLDTSQQVEAARDLSIPKEAAQHPDAPRLAGYILAAPIGEGACARVWRAWQERTRKWVAIKVFERAHGLNWILLQREIDRLVKLDKHPYIVSLLDADLVGKTPYYVLDLIEGGSLERHLSKRISVDKIARLMEEVAEALAYVHSKGIIHCDLKPANILLDDEGRPRVADFGQSRVFHDSSAALGTMFYMAPEQADEHGVPDVRWDVYALGATFFNVLTGRRPHDDAAGSLAAAGTVEQRLKLYRDTVRAEGAPAWDRSAVDEDLRAVVSRCLAPEPGRRYASMSAVLADLHARRESRPVSPLAHDRRYRARKFLRRNRVLSAVTAAAAAALLAAGVRLVKERDNLRAQLAVSFLARSQLEFMKGNPLRAITYGAHSNELLPSELARASTLWYLSETAAPRFVYPGEGPAVFSSDGRLVAASDPAFGAEIRSVATAARTAGPLRTRGDVLALAFDASGRLLATGTRDKSLQVWDAASGAAVGPPIETGGAVTALAFSPGGRLLASGDSQGSVRLFEVGSGRSVGSRDMSHGERVTTALFSPDGGTLMTASEEDHTAALWSVPGGALRSRIHLQERVHGLALSPDGRLLAVAGGDNTVRFWSLRDGRATGVPLRSGTHVLVAAFSPDGRRLIAGGWDAQAQIWDVESREPIGKPMRSTADVVAAAFSPDGRLVATGSNDTTAQIWDAATQEPYGRLLEHPTALRSVRFTPDGKGLLTTTVGGSARLWSVAAAAPAERSLGRDEGPWDAAFSPDGRKVAVANKDGAAVVFDAASGAPLLRLAHESGVNVARFSPDGRTLVTGSWNGRLRLWDAADGRLEAQGPQSAYILFAQFSPDGRTIMAASADGAVRLYRAPDLSPLPLAIKHPRGLTAASLSPDGRLVLTAGRDNTARLWDAATGKPVGREMRHADDVNCAAFSPDGSLVLTGSSDLTARLWRSPSGDPVPGFLIRHKDGVRIAAFSPDGKKIVTGGADQRMRLWRTSDGASLGPLMQHAGVIVSVSFSPDGKFLLSAGAERLARLWDAGTSISIRSFAHGHAVTRALFSPDGRRILTASSDDGAKLWDVPWLNEPLSPEDLLRLSDRATTLRINAAGEMRTISPQRWEEAFLERPAAER